jgi:hypothetical protein
VQLECRRSEKNLRATEKFEDISVSIGFVSTARVSGWDKASQLIKKQASLTHPLTRMVLTSRSIKVDYLFRIFR